MFFSEVMKMAGLDPLKVSAGYSMVNFNGEVLYIDGFNKALVLSREKISLDFKKCVIDIIGQLNIEFLDDKALLIKGEIVSISKENKGDNDEKGKKQIKRK